MGKKRKACMFCLGNLKARDNQEDIVVKGLITLKWTLKKLDWGEGSVAWIHLALGRDKWRFPINTVMNLRVPYNAGIY
jgi:hypothetical protein